KCVPYINKGGRLKVNFTIYSLIPYLFVLLILILTIIYIIHEYQQKKFIREQIEGLERNSIELTPEEFFYMRSASFGGRGKPRYANQFNFPGVYLLYNHSRDMYYVGQGK